MWMWRLWRRRGGFDFGGGERCWTLRIGWREGGMGWRVVGGGKVGRWLFGFVGGGEIGATRYGAVS